MRNINLWTILICVAGVWYINKYYPRTPANTNPIGVAVPQAQTQRTDQPSPAQAPQQAFTPPPVLYKCQPANGQTIYKDTPCGEAKPTAVIQQAPPREQTALDRKIASDMAQAERDAEAAARLKALNEDLARKWDQRMAQRDRDLANEQASLTVQANAANAACAAWRQEKETAVANLRRGGDAQWMNFWNQRFHAANNELYRNHC